MREGKKQKNKYHFGQDWGGAVCLWQPRMMKADGGGVGAWETIAVVCVSPRIYRRDRGLYIPSQF